MMSFCRCKQMCMTHTVRAFQIDCISFEVQDCTESSVFMRTGDLSSTSLFSSLWPDKCACRLRQAGQLIKTRHICFIAVIDTLSCIHRHRLMASELNRTSFVAGVLILVAAQTIASPHPQVK